LDQSLLVYAASVALLAGTAVLVFVTLAPVIIGRRASRRPDLAVAGGRTQAARTGPWARMPLRPRIMVVTTNSPEQPTRVAAAPLQADRAYRPITAAREGGAGFAREQTIPPMLAIRHEQSDVRPADDRRVEGRDRIVDPKLAMDIGGPEPTLLVDALTGAASAAAWSEAIAFEDRRFARYRRPATVVLAELDGLESVVAQLGPEAADRLIGPIGATLRRGARTSDFVARVGHARFAVLLTETDEVAATNFVERVRAACDLWFAAGRSSVRLACGWAMPIPGSHISDALRIAADRMDADRRRVDFRAPIEFPEPLPRPDRSQPQG
jgi:diguanylate cyclase (GGDEF)-like protein